MKLRDKDASAEFQVLDPDTKKLWQINPHDYLTAWQVKKMGNRPDMILLDLMMPSIKGESLCEILKKSSFGRGIPIIIFSTKEESEIKQLAEDAGAEGYIVKRMNKRDIVDSVEYFFKKFCKA